VTITTEEAARDSQVAMVVYGEEGNSGEIILGTAGQLGMFQTGNQDQFKVGLCQEHFTASVPNNVIVCLWNNTLYKDTRMAQTANYYI
jgi:hypothetical protein